MHYNTEHYKTIHHRTTQNTTLQNKTAQHITILYEFNNSIKPSEKDLVNYYTTQHHITLQYKTALNKTLHYTTEQCNTQQNFTLRTLRLNKTYIIDLINLINSVGKKPTNYLPVRHIAPYSLTLNKTIIMTKSALAPFLTRD